MNGVELLLVVIASIAVSSVAQKRGLQAPLVLVTIGAAVSFVPGLPRLEIEPDVILGFVLPPLLYSTAIEFSFINFVRNLWPILGLGVLLVVVTALAVGYTSDWLIPALTLPVGLVLGAVVAPPDAVTAVAIGRRLGLPKRVMTILTGESLVNDAAALTTFTITLAAVTGETAFIPNPLLYFGYSVLVGLFVGVVLSALARIVQQRLDDPALQTVMSIVLPFAAYLAAEELHGSGVVAVVMAGFSMGHNADKTGFATRLEERHVWRSVDVLLEAFVFAYMGLQVKFVLAEVTHEGKSLGTVLLGALLILVVVLAIRPVWVLANHARLLVLRWFVRRRVAATDEETRLRYARQQRRRAGRLKPEPRVLPLKQELVIAWTGMRGVVTLAAAAGIPFVTSDGAVFPARADVQVIALVVAVGTLLIQGLTLPFLIRKLDLDSTDEEAETARQLEHAQQVSQQAGQQAMRESFRRNTAGVNSEVVERLADRWRQLQQDRQQMQSESEDSELGRDPQSRQQIMDAFQQVRIDMVNAQRVALTAERDAFRLDDDLYRQLLEQLDYDEAATTIRSASRLS